MVMSSRIFFNVRPYQSRVAYIRDGCVRDIFYQRESSPTLVGAIYKGRVSRLSKGLNFAFVDIGLDKAGFLYGKDVNDGKKPLSRELQLGQEVMVQIKSDANRDKGTRLSMDIALPGKYLVYIPGQKGGKNAVSRRIADRKEKARLSKILDGFKEPGALLVRTLGEEKSLDDFKNDLESLKNQWETLQELFQQKASVGEMQKSPSLGLSYLRDFSDSIDEIFVDDKETYQEMKAFLKVTRPGWESRLKFHSKKEPLFEAFSIDSQIEEIFSRKVRLKNGGFLVIEELEAFTVIDVNSGRYMGKKTPASTILDLNLEAAEMIARQVRLRHLAGIILVDFIDMENPEDGEKLVSCLQEGFAEDKSCPRVFPMGELGMVQITRKRTYPSLSAFVSEKCTHCSGTGRLKSVSSIAIEILIALEKFALRRRSWFQRKISVRLFCHPDVKSWIEKQPQALGFLKKEFAILLELVPRKNWPINRFEIKKSS